MRAILLAAGFGTRLRPLTDSIPKCLVPIHGKPLLEIWLESLTAAHVGPCLINTHYLYKAVEGFISKSRFADSVVLVHEAELLGTAGTAIANLQFFGEEDGMLIHADNYCRADIHSFIDAHYRRPPECLMTMMAFRTEDPTSCGILEVNERGVATAMHEKVSSPPGNLANGAVYILSRDLIQMLRGQLNWATDFSLDVLPKLMGRIFIHETAESFIDIGSPTAYAQANRL
jgi:mannose-1-phosphate guanylyltransferase